MCLYRNTSKTNSSHSEQNSSSWLLAIKIPAIASDLTVNTTSVSYQIVFVALHVAIASHRLQHIHVSL